MIVRIDGILEEIYPLSTVIKNNNIFYKIHSTLSVYEKYKTKIGSSITLHTRLIVNKDFQYFMYGFIDQREAETFDFLISLSGIGAQTAVNLISSVGSQEFYNAIEDSKIEILIKVPGIGKSKAEKILFEAGQKLKSKRKKYAVENISSSTLSRESSSIDDMCANVLISLGFSEKEIYRAENKIALNQKTSFPEKKEENLDQWIKIYLKYL